MRARDSVVQSRLDGELKGYYQTDTFEPQEVSIAIPKLQIKEKYQGKGAQGTWERTKWSCKERRSQPDANRIRKLYSIYTSNAKEIQRSILRSQDVYTYGNACSWLDVAAPILNFV